MVQVSIPSALRNLTGGETSFEFPASTVREILAALDEQFPGLSTRLADPDRLRPGLAVSVDGEIVAAGIEAKVKPDSDVCFTAAIGGG